MHMHSAHKHKRTHDCSLKVRACARDFKIIIVIIIAIITIVIVVVIESPKGPRTQIIGV